MNAFERSLSNSSLSAPYPYLKNSRGFGVARGVEQLTKKTHLPKRKQAPVQNVEVSLR